MSTRAGQWPRAYRPLRPASLLAQLVFVVAAELVLYASYASHDARFHWATHFLVALLVTALWQSLHLLVAARPARGQLATVVIFHIWAMWPDLLFRVGVPHYHWMDWLSLGHVSSHYLPGGDTSWLVLALLGAGGYAVLLARWVSARSTEAAAGLSPALGVGGAGVLRPQADPRTEPLAHEYLGPAEPTDLAPVLLLHGLGATSATWVAAGRVLAAAGHRVVIPDLLGFGSSLRIGTRFRLKAVGGLAPDCDHGKTWGWPSGDVVRSWCRVPASKRDAGAWSIVNCGLRARTPDFLTTGSSGRFSTTVDRRSDRGCRSGALRGP